MLLGDWASIATIVGTAMVVAGIIWGGIRWIARRRRGGLDGDLREVGYVSPRDPAAVDSVPEEGAASPEVQEDEADEGGTWGLTGAAQAEGRSTRPVLVARELMTAVGFKDRGKELAEIGKLVDEGRGVIWVTGQAQSGKSWLESHFARNRGWKEKAARFELRGGADVEAVLEGVNRFLRDHNEHRFDCWCRTVNAAVADKAAALCTVLKGGGYVIVLDSFEDVAEDAGWADLVRVMQEGLEGSWVLVGSRVRPEWADRHAEVEVGPMEREAAEELLTDAGAPSEGRDELFAAVGGLPGALELAGALAQDQGAKTIAADVKGAAGHVGETLLAETFDAAGQGAQKLWTGLCLLPSPVTRGTAEALCQRDDFEEAWTELVRRKLLDPGEERAELHPLARSIGERRLEKMADWRRACGERIAKYYGDFAKAKRDDRAAIEGELENVMEAARLAFRYREWEALWGMGYALGEPLMYAGRWTAREELLRLCLEGARRAPDLTRRKEFGHNLGVALQGRGDLDGAMRLYRESIQVAEEQNDRPGEAIILHQLGMVAQDRGKLEEAEGLHKQARDVFGEIGDRRSLAAVLHQLGNVAQERGKLEEAEGLYQESLEIKREAGDRPGEAQTRHALAILAQERGKWDEAAAECEACLQLYRDLAMRPEEAMALHMKGMLAQERGNLEEAEGLYQESLDIELEVGNRPGEAISYETLALLAEEQGDLRLAVERMEKAAGMMEEMGLGEAERARGDLERLRGALRASEARGER